MVASHPVDRIVNLLPAHIWLALSVLMLGIGLILIAQGVEFPRINNDSRDSEVVKLEPPPLET